MGASNSVRAREGASYATPIPNPSSPPLTCLPGAVHLDQLGLRPVAEGGKLWLHVPDDEGLLTETQTAGPLNLATDAHIYLDLQRAGLRGPDAATALREWEGFCRP